MTKRDIDIAVNEAKTQLNGTKKSKHTDYLIYSEYADNQKVYFELESDYDFACNQEELEVVLRRERSFKVDFDGIF